MCNVRVTAESCAHGATLLDVYAASTCAVDWRERIKLLKHANEMKRMRRREAQTVFSRKARRRR